MTRKEGYNLVGQLDVDKNFSEWRDDLLALEKMAVGLPNILHRAGLKCGRTVEEMRPVKVWKDVTFVFLCSDFLWWKVVISGDVAKVYVAYHTQDAKRDRGELD